jgi:hypothetical protein
MKDMEDTASRRKTGMRLPILALCLDILPVLIILLSSIAKLELSSFAVILIVLSPIAGFISGALSLVMGKGWMGIIGKVTAAAAVALPIAFLAVVLVFFIGAATGLISLK